MQVNEIQKVITNLLQYALTDAGVELGSASDALTLPSAYRTLGEC